jgi:hypothetical protein
MGFFLIGNEKTTEKVKKHCLSNEQPNKRTLLPDLVIDGIQLFLEHASQRLRIGVA